MKKRAAQVFRGWLELSQEEKQEVINAINEFLNATPQGKATLQARTLNEATATFSFDTGPTGSRSCPCCGRG